MSTPLPESQVPAVLYVDDEEQALKYFRRGLEKDFRVLTASGVAAAMTILEQEQANVGVVITDQRMPGKSGVTLLTEVRERWPAIVRILITAYTDIDSAVAAVNAGAVYKYINKPADFPLLQQMLREALEVHRETRHRDALAQIVAELEAQRAATLAAEAQREQLQQRLIAASREAGRAEVATGILHNVGNVLNSVNVAAAVVNETLKNSRVGNLCKGLSLLEEHRGDLPDYLINDERGKRLPNYLIKLAAVLAEEQKAVADAMVGLNRNIEHIAHIVRVQQAFGKEKILQQPLKPDELMNDAVRVNQALLEKHGVRIERSYGELPVLQLDQHRVLQILINLISNAARAVKDNAPDDRKLMLRISAKAAAQTERICFEVVDNGMGIAPENLMSIFTFGFTTREDGHGFGLHSAANAAREMGGALSVSSDGLGRGAAFCLELPMLARAAGQLPQQHPSEKVAA